MIQLYPMATVVVKGLNNRQQAIAFRIKFDMLDSDSVTRAVRRTRTSDHLRRPVFAVAGPRVWNSLPTELRQSDSLGQFKRRLKTHLFGL